MDALDHLVSQCLSVADGADPAHAIGEVLSGADLRLVRASVVGRTRPWFFHAGSDLTVFATSAAPGTGSAPHDHGLWAVIACLDGREGARRYEARDGELIETGRGCLHSGDVHVLPAGAIHAVFNCWTEPNVVLHLYGGDFMTAPKRVWDPITGTSSALGLTEPLAPLGDTR